MSVSAHLVEVFSGIQGEGLAVGERQVFVRFAGCNLACPYCDTPEARRPVPFAQVERAPGGRDFERVANPVTPGVVASWIARLDAERRHRAVTLTGGEPLLAAEFIAALLPLCEGRRIYLETNGTLPDALETLVDQVDTVAMDIKLPPAGEGADLATARAFLAIAARREVVVKVVLTSETRPGDVLEAAGTVASVRRNIPLVLQPVTPVSPSVRPPPARALLDLQAQALAALDDVRVIPQIHRLMGQR